MADVSVRLEPPLSFIEAQGGAFRAALDDLTPLWERFKGVMAALGEERWDSHGYGEWPGLAASTIKQKAAHNWPSDPLVRTGDLRDSLVDPSIAAQDVGPQSFSWGSPVAYAHWHQDGGDDPGRPPQRKILEIRVEDRQRLEREQVSWINQVAADTWGRT